MEWAFGDPRSAWHPVAIFGALADHVERWFYGDSRLRGAVAVVAVVGPIAGALSFLAAPESLIEAVVAASVLWATIGWRSLLEHVRAVADARDLGEARKKLSLIVGRDTEELSWGDVHRGALESLAENAADGVAGPLFWFAIGGAPAAALYRMINTLDAMWGHRNARYSRFGWFAARTDDVMSAIPSRLTAACLLLLSRRWPEKRFFDSARAHPSPNAGWPEAAMAHGLGVRLGGPVHRVGVPEPRGWMGPDEGREATREDTHRGLALAHRALLLLSGLAVAVAAVTT